MRRLVLCILVMAVLLPALAWSQNTGLSSLLLDWSFGVFGNPLDTAANVGKDFRTLTNDYLFGGLGNLNNESTTGLFGSSLANPLWMGYYRAGNVPWSVFTGLHHEDGPTASGSQTQYIGPNTETVISGTTSTDYYWYDQVAVTERCVPAYTEINDSAQFLFDLGGFNLGASVNVLLQNSTVPAVNYTTTDTFQYNTVGGGVIPVTAVDYTRTTEATDLTDGAGGAGIDNQITLGVPLYWKALDATANLTIGVLWQNYSTTYSRLYSVPRSSANIGFGANQFTNTEQADTLISGFGVPVELQFEKALAPFVGTHAGNAFKVGGDAQVTFTSSTYSDILITQNYTYVVAGASTPAARNWDTQDASYGGIMDIGVGAHASHSFYLDPAPNVNIGFVPRLDLVYRNQPVGPSVSTVVIVNRTDGNADGQFNAAADTIVTTQRTYDNTMAIPVVGNVDAETDHVIECDFELPSALRFQVLPWFGVTLGARPRLTGTFTITSTTGSTYQETVTTTNGTGAVTSTVVTNEESADLTTTYDMAWTATVDHAFGVAVGVPGGIMLYVDINGAVNSGVWDFKNLVIQGVIPLPAATTK